MRAAGAGLFLTADTVGGIWRYTADLARGLDAQGRAVTLATVGPPPDASQRAELPAGVTLIESGVPLDWLADTPGELDRAAGTLAALAQGHAAALLHAPAFLRMEHWPVPVAVMAHSSLTTWWQAVRGCPVEGCYAWRAAAAAAGFRRADAVAAPTAAFAETIRQTYGLREVRVIRNGRAPMALPDVIRRRAVLTAGRLWDDGKDVALLDRVAPGLSAPILAAGHWTGPDGGSKHLANLRLLGALSQPELAEALAGATVFASAALYEPFGLAVLEAALGGMALVLSDIPTLRELWDGAAIFAPPRDEQAWRSALETALADPGPWAARARTRASRYGLASMTDGAAALLDSLCGRVMA